MKPDQPANKKKRSRVKIILLALLCCLVFLALWAFVIEPSRLVLRETRIILPSWPASLKGLRIAVISDLHAGSPYITLDKIHQIIEMTNAAQPDLILLPGDFVIQGVAGGRFMEPEVIASALKGLRARFGIFATLGNHDWWYNGPRVKKALENVGVTVLENDAAMIERNGVAIWIAGIGDKWEGNPDIPSALAGVNDSAAVIALTHNPDIFPSIPARVALTIAGHTHGGQVLLPGVGAIAGREFPVLAGQARQINTTLFVSRGVGTVYIPVRINCPPEVAILTLKSRPQA